ncbi:hypothetical protein IPL85_00950 [Candidatus Saccharibacteria bacterium]|nr:MAG: hypothetical protein IPL85_00950 [Candidatus Saccharibacteria bacterium]
MKKSIIKLSLLAACAIVFVAAPFASAASSYKLAPWTYVGTVADCGSEGTPGGAVARMDGLVGNPAPSLYLEKNVPLTDCVAAGATIENVAGATVETLSFEYKNGGLCTGGSPRFNLVGSDSNLYFVGGCGNGTQTDLGNGWTRVDLDVSNPTQSFPVVPSGVTVDYLEIMIDETGSTYIDNVRVNGVLVSEPTVSSDCKKNGWKDLSTSDSKPFKNQGQCVAYFQSNEASKHHRVVTVPSI